MASNSFWILALVAFVFLIQSSVSLRCWTCTSDRSPECGDPMNITQHHKDFHTRDCEATASQNSYAYNERSICKKLVQRENGREVIRRSCEIPGPEERDITNGPCASHDSTHSHVTIVSCHICNTDLCNSATSLSGSQILFLTAIAFVASSFVPAIKSFSF
ncbi:protein quiver-like [Chelonus insularis]|uniref:protein quiver-like n=1 Tax=Chelonus insularis TaxID=460826 RepID=UPI0015886C34|nr:protein quiver-like [Chelonus insularis]